MKHFIYIILCVLGCSFAMSAATPKRMEVRKVDFEEIRKRTQDTIGSRCYYPRLMAAYLRNDSTLLNDTLPSGEIVRGEVMTIDDYRHLYYGYVFEEDYNPYRYSIFSEQLDDLYSKKEFTREESVMIKDCARNTLKDNLFDLRQMSFYVFALREIHKDNLANIYNFRLQHLVAAIMSSGQGTQEHPWVITSPEHEYNIINILGYVAISHEVLDNGIEYIKVNKKDSKSPEGFYFDASKILEVLKVKYPDETE